MAAQVRIVFTPVLNALKSGIAQAKNMLKGVFGDVQRIPLREFGVGELTGEIAKIVPVSENVASSLQELRSYMSDLGKSPFVANATENIEILKATGGEFSNLRDAIIGTINKYRDLQNQVDKWGLSAQNTAKVTASLQAGMESANDALARKFLPNFKELETALRATGYEGGVMSATAEQIERALNQASRSTINVNEGIAKFGKNLGSSGKRLSWFGFRLLMVGRIFTRFITKTLKGAIQGFTKWDDSITQIGTSMGFLAASGMLTADVQNMMVGAMTDLPRVGMMTQGIMGALSALFISMGSTVLPILGGALLDLITAISEVWETTKADLIPIFETLATETIPSFIDIIKSVGPDAITGFVSGLETGINALTDLLDALEPHLPAFSEFLGYLVGISPLLMAAGMALFFMSVPMQLLSSTIGIMSGAFGTVKGAIASTSLGFTGLGIVLLIIAGFVAALILHWDELVAFWGKTVGPAIERLFNAFGDLSEALGGSKTAMGLLKGATIPFKIALQVVMIALGGIISMIETVIISITWLVNAFKRAGKWISSIFGDSKNSIQDFNDTHDSMIQDLEDAYGHSIGDLMAEQYDTARDSLEQLLESQMNPTVIPQTIPIEINITVENMSSEMDLDTMTDEVSRKLASKIEGAFR